MFKRLFVDHPNSVDETYFEHMVFALGFAALLGLAASAALIHAVIPGLYKSTASQLIRRMYDRIEYRGSIKPPAE